MADIKTESLEPAHWYVIHTYAGYEKKVAKDLENIVTNRNLQNMILDVKIPKKTVTETVLRNKNGKKVPVEEDVEYLYFPGYVLVKMVMTNDTWFIVRNTRGCTGFVGHDSKLVPDSKPVPLTDEEAAKWGVEIKVKENPLVVGEEVKIVKGVLTGQTGKVVSIDLDAQTVKISYGMLNSDTVDIDISKVVPLN